MADYDLQNEAYSRKHHGLPLPVAECKLDSGEALRRAVELQDDAWHPTELAVSPGQVKAHNGRIVEHTCSTFPGMSGSAGVDLHVPWKLLFIHTRTDADPCRNVSYGISVQHPLFVQAYVREVLPLLSATPRSSCRTSEHVERAAEPLDNSHVCRTRIVLLDVYN